MRILSGCIRYLAVLCLPRYHGRGHSKITCMVDAHSTLPIGRSIGCGCLNTCKSYQIVSVHLYRNNRKLV